MNTLSRMNLFLYRFQWGRALSADCDAEAELLMITQIEIVSMGPRLKRGLRPRRHTPS